MDFTAPLFDVSGLVRVTGEYEDTLDVQMPDLVGPWCLPYDTFWIQAHPLVLIYVERGLAFEHEGLDDHIAAGEIPFLASCFIAAKRGSVHAGYFQTVTRMDFDRSETAHGVHLLSKMENGEPWPEPQRTTLGTQMEACQGLLFCALQFLNCKNVTTCKVSPPAKLSKKWKRKHGFPLTDYYVLKVHENLTGSAAGGGGKELNRHHLCRGHLRTYTEEAPLFGRLTGTFYIPPHARGSRERGTLHKDYELTSTPQ